MNNREDNEFIMERLDRAFASIEWINMYPSYSLRNLPIIKFDHGLLFWTLNFSPHLDIDLLDLSICGLLTHLVRV